MKTLHSDTSSWINGHAKKYVMWILKSTQTLELLLCKLIKICLLSPPRPHKNVKLRPTTRQNSIVLDNTPNNKVCCITTLSTTSLLQSSFLFIVLQVIGEIYLAKTLWLKYVNQAGSWKLTALQCITVTYNGAQFFYIPIHFSHWMKVLWT